MRTRGQNSPASANNHPELPRGRYRLYRNLLELAPFFLYVLLAASAKTQKMPLPELQSRKKATAAALKARREEAKALGVSSHIDAQGSVQQAARNRSKLASQKQRRKHLRDTFKHAGKYSDKRMRSGGGKK